MGTRTRGVSLHITGNEEASCLLDKAVAHTDLRGSVSTAQRPSEGTTAAAHRHDAKDLPQIGFTLSLAPRKAPSVGNRHSLAAKATDLLVTCDATIVDLKAGNEVTETATH
jgi:hypothetical protein